MGLLKKALKGTGDALQQIGEAGIEDRRLLRLQSAKEQTTLAAEGRAEKRRIQSDKRLEDRNIAGDERRSIREAANLKTKSKPVSVKSTSKIGGEESTEFLQTMTNGKIYVLDSSTGSRTPFEDIAAAKASIKETEDNRGIAAEYLETLRDAEWSPFDREFIDKRFGGSDEAATNYIAAQIKAGKDFVSIEKDLLSGAPAETETDEGDTSPTIPSTEAMITVGDKKMPLDEFIKSRVGDDVEKQQKLLAKLRSDDRFKSLYSAIDTRINTASQ